MATVTKCPFKGSSRLHSLDGRKAAAGIDIGLWGQPDRHSEVIEAV